LICYLGRIVPLLLLLFIWTVPVSGADQPEAAAGALRQGIELYQAGETPEALDVLRSFVVRNSDSPLLPEAYLWLARIFTDKGQPEEALLYLNKIAEKELRPEMRLLKGVALVRAGRHDQGISLLQGVENEKLAPVDRQLHLLSLAQGHAAKGLFLPALSFLYTALNLPAAPAEELLRQAHALLRERLKDAELEEAISLYGNSAIGEDARLQKAERALAAGESLKARLLLAEVARSGIPFPQREEAMLLLERLLGENGVERSVGVILPLSGRYATFGEQVRRGMELARQVHGDSTVRFHYVDADGEAEKSAQAVSELAMGERVMAIAGPLTGAAAMAAAARAEQEQVPLLTLSQREGLPEVGNYVFRDSLTSRLQVQALANHAIAEKITTFGILYPENKLGREMAELFEQEVTARGGKITDKQSYAESATDFRQQVRLLQRRDPAVPDRDDLPKEKANQEKIHFQALFIPDYAERVGLIAPQIVYYGLEGMQLLGINGWNSPDLLRLAGKFVEGAVFVDGFFLDSPHPVVSKFVRLYTEKYGEEPGILEAQGFDAAGILLAVFKDPTVKSRETLRQALANVRNYQGVTGTTSFNPQGEAEKSLFLLQVQNGKVVQIN
jgi:ABC-type branched-subunit amino acid transport system substrate-binding protein